MDALQEWLPTGDFSPAEEFIMFRMNFSRGKILQFQGKFQDYLKGLSESRYPVHQHGELYFTEGC